MNSKQKFENFLESLKKNGNKALIESVKKGFRACLEYNEDEEGLYDEMVRTNFGYNDIEDVANMMNRWHDWEEDPMHNEEERWKEGQQRRRQYDFYEKELKKHGYKELINYDDIVQWMSEEDANAYLDNLRKEGLSDDDIYKETDPEYNLQQAAQGRGRWF